MQNDLIKEVVEEVGKTNEETELEKEVGKVMTQQNEAELAGEVLDETAVITKGMRVTGDISSQGSMDILGVVKGNVEILGKLSVSGQVEGNSVAEEIFADSAKITGEIRARGSVKVGQSSVLIGNIFATSAVIAGAVKGDIDVQGPVILDTSAIVMGNIKSKSVQINNGAVIEGMCSQCYADVNPTSFFKDLD
ncbi:MAG: polymer-forming cytoskeletal protein [Lachnospiraceae bacterium]|nr:polymer-forming cytoskeletal protein [Lachnospiraceae bacterium]